MKESTSVNLQIEEQEQIKKEIKSAIEGFENGQKKMPQGMLEKIQRAANSGVKELFEDACLLVYYAIKKRYTHVARTSYVNKTKSSEGGGKKKLAPLVDEGDFIYGPLYEVVHKHIKSYDGKHSLLTYFEPHVKSAFMREKEKGRNIRKEKHYANSYVTIKAAIEEMAKKGFLNPSPHDISLWLWVYKRKKISATTIERVNHMNINFTSIDEDVKNIGSYNNDPSRIVLQKGDNDYFWDLQNELTPISKRFIEEALEFTDRFGCVPSYDDAYTICKKFKKDVTKSEAAKIKQRAYNEMRFRDKRHKKHEESPINNMRMISDVLIMEEEEEEIAAGFLSGEFSLE